MESNTNAEEPQALPIETEKKRNTSFGLSLSNTTYRSPIIAPSLKDPMEIGGWSCGKCGISLPHDDYVGITESRGFRVYGYHCRACGNRWLNEKRAKEEERKGQKFMTMGKWEIKRSSQQVTAEEIDKNDDKNDLFGSRESKLHKV